MGCNPSAENPNVPTRPPLNTPVPTLPGVSTESPTSAPSPGTYINPSTGKDENSVAHYSMPCFVNKIYTIESSFDKQE